MPSGPPITPVTAASNDWTDANFDALVTMAARLRTDPVWLLSFMMNESDCRTTACARSHAGNPVAVGLNQILCQRENANTPSNLETCGWTGTPEAYLHLNVGSQLPYVERYLHWYAGKLNSLAACYVADFHPADLAHATDPSFILVDPRPASHRYPDQYEPNLGLDHDRKGYITVSDLTDAITRACVGQRWNELSGRLNEAISRAMPVTMPSIPPPPMPLPTPLPPEPVIPPPEPTDPNIDPNLIPDIDLETDPDETDEQKAFDDDIKTEFS